MMAKATVVFASQEEYDLYSRAHTTISEEMRGFFEDEEEREQVGEDVVDAIITIVHPTFIIENNFAEQWEDLGMEDWEWNHIFGSLIKHVSPTLVQQLLKLIEEIHGGWMSFKDEDDFRTKIEERITDSLTNHIPNEAVLEMDMRAYVGDYEGESSWINDAVYDGLGSFVLMIKKNAIKEIAIMLFNSRTEN
jgi:hypothetical protein